ncbi:G-protein coupled receptor 151-like [Latimeria chalumnae]|uniref:G-protein coupled receptor 151-like n=1 Tax=Latimeria chalumnae TaxID=7897 RepID=UPI0006D9078C|nr:PREDICTED: probable G-protein coupled receptor 151 [Latimeria chalumnae]|eukprot:XP_006008821.2 PREDICTED: probable G-protein coupled receptor 151 [Latimeria chalumnae]
MNSSRASEFAGGLQLVEGMEFTVALPLILAFICLIGFVGNLLMIAVLINDFRKGKSSVVNCLAVNLCSSDLLIAFFCIPIRAATFSKQTWIFGGFICKTSDWFLHSCLTAKSFTMAVMGQARYKFVVNPPRFKNLKPKRLGGMLFFLWSLALVLPVPQMVFSSIHEDPAGNLCFFRVPPYASKFMNVFSKTYPLLAFVLPMIFAVGCYLRILLRNEKKRFRVTNLRHQSKRVTLMLMSSNLAFAGMWFPEWVAWIWARHSSADSPQPPTALLVLAQLLVFANGTTNPVLFFVMSEELRGGLRSLWGFLTCRRSRGAASTRNPKAGKNGAGRIASAVLSLQDLQAEASPSNAEASKEKCEKVLPDVEHFWQDRRNASAGEDNDPTPWERQE